MKEESFKNVISIVATIFSILLLISSFIDKYLGNTLDAIYGMCGVIITLMWVIIIRIE